MDVNLIKQTGIKAAFESGKVLKSYFGNISDIRKKGPVDLVTEADTASEKIIIGLATGFPYDLLLRCYHYSKLNSFHDFIRNQNG